MSGLIYSALGAIALCAFVLAYMASVDDDDRVDLPDSATEL